MAFPRFNPLLLVCLLQPALAQGQIVNVQALFSEEAGQGLSGATEASVEWRTGSTDLLALRASLVGQYRTETSAFLALARGEYALAAEEQILGRLLEHLRFRRALTPALSAEAFAQHELDAFRRLELRALVGAGPRWRAWSGEDGSIVLGAAPMLEHERLRDDGLPDAGAVTTDLRLSSYLLLRFQLGERLELAQTLYAQPLFVRPRDLRILNETQLLSRATQRLALGLTFTAVYDAAPPATVSKLDTSVRSTLGLTF